MESTRQLLEEHGMSGRVTLLCRSHAEMTGAVPSGLAAAVFNLGWLPGGDHGITTRYESMIGSGMCEFIRDEGEIIHGLKLITEHYGYPDYDLAHCRALDHVYVGKIVLEEITGKQNLPADGRQRG